MPPSVATRWWTSSPPDGVLIVRAGGVAGLFSAIIGGWPGQRVREECQAVTKKSDREIVHEPSKLRDPTAETLPTGAPALHRPPRSRARPWR